MSDTAKVRAGDVVRLVVPDNPVVDGREGVVAEVCRGPAELGGVAYLLVQGTGVGSGEFRALYAEVTRSVQLNGAEHREMGYTGDVCSGCGGSKMRRNGSCLVCEDCGQTTGCS